MAKRTVTSSSRAKIASFLSDVGNFFRGLSKATLHPYRPELHYMRGPKPKVARKHREAVGEDEL